jgi:hypothetical protein
MPPVPPNAAASALASSNSASAISQPRFDQALALRRVTQHGAHPLFGGEKVARQGAADLACNSGDGIHEVLLKLTASR